MNTAMVLAPIAVTDAMLTTSIPETDYPEYVAGTTYAAGVTVQITSLHRVYRSAVAGNVGHYPPDNIYDDEPETPTGYWIDGGSTNARAMFDGKSRASSSALNRIEVILVPGQAVTAIGLMNVYALRVTVMVVTPGEGLVFFRELDMVDLGGTVGFFAWCFSPPVRKDTAVVIDMPYSPDATITITATAQDETVTIGELVIGRTRMLGTLENGVGMSLEDYSTKTKDDAGNATLKAGIYADTISLPIKIDSSMVASIRRLLAGYHGTPLVFIGNQDFYETIIYAWYNRLSVVIPGNTFSECSIELEELS